MQTLKPFTYLCLLFIPGFIFAQQLPIISFYSNHWSVINPAGVSSNYIVQDMDFSTSGTVQQQWLKIPEAPKTQVLSFECINDDPYPIAFGGHLINDKTGAFGQTGLYGNLAYRLRLDETKNNILAGGLSFGGVQYRADFAEILDGSNQLNGLSIDDLDKLSNSNQTFFDVGLGLMLFLEAESDKRYYYFGVSSPQTFNLNTTYRTLKGDFAIERTRHFYAMAGAYFIKNKNSRNSNDLSFLEITLLGGYVPDSPFGIDANVRYQYKGIWGGIGGGLSKILHLEAGAQLGSSSPFRLGIAYNQFLTNLNTNFGQTLEASFSYAWQK